LILCCRIPEAPLAALLVQRETEAPELSRRPLVVGGNRGEARPVLAASAEARAYGVLDGMPLRQAERLCPQARFLPRDPAAEARLGEELLAAVHALAPRVEPGTGAQVFADLAGAAGREVRATEAVEWAREIGAHVGCRLHVRPGLGVGSGRLVAAVAAAEAPAADADAPAAVADALDSLVVIVPPGGERGFLAGRSLPPELARLDDRGPLRPWAPPAWMEERTWVDPPARDPDAMREVIGGLLERLAARMAQAGCAATAAAIDLEAEIGPARPPGAGDRRLALASPHRDAAGLWRELAPSLGAAPSGGVALATVGVGGFVPAATRPADIRAGRDRRLDDIARWHREQTDALWSLPRRG
jgi:hypothetical protein